MLSSAGKLVRETLSQIFDRVVPHLAEIGKFNDEEYRLVDTYARSLKAFMSGRALWVGGTEWARNPANVGGFYNCVGMPVNDPYYFDLPFHSLYQSILLSMMGCGVGVQFLSIDTIPPIVNKINIEFQGEYGAIAKFARFQETVITGNTITIGDSKEGWAKAFYALFQAAINPDLADNNLVICISHVRPEGEKLSGFGGVANPVKLKPSLEKFVAILQHAYGRQLTSLEACLLLDYPAQAIVAGNIRRSAAMRQFNFNDTTITPWLGRNSLDAKTNLWVEDPETKKWKIDPERDALQMGNHTHVYWQKPDYQTVLQSVTKQVYTGEGAIQFAPEALYRCNSDIIPVDKSEFIKYFENPEFDVNRYFKELGVSDNYEAYHRANRFSTNPCAEVLGHYFKCNLSEVHLVNIDPLDRGDLIGAFQAATLEVAALLHQKFPDPQFQRSRELDPIVLVGFTGLFDYFVKLFGEDWLLWWKADRNDNFEVDLTEEKFAKYNRIKEVWNVWEIPLHKFGKFARAVEREFFDLCRSIVKLTLRNYCRKHKLVMPQRYTGVKPAGTGTLLTGGASGWNAPKAPYYIRRITTGKNDPVARAALDYGYPIRPGTTDRDSAGNLLTDPFDDRCNTWLVEMPIAVPWADVADRAGVDLNFSAVAQMDFYREIQNYYTTHNTSATIDCDPDEKSIENLAKFIYEMIDKNEGYVSVAILGRYPVMPFMPFEPISKDKYEALQKEVLANRKVENFKDALDKYDTENAVAAGPNACDSDGCEIKKN